MAPTNREWEEVVLEKRKLRDEAIQKFEEEHRSEPRDTHEAATKSPTENDNVDGILAQIRSNVVTATELCTAYISRAIEAHRQTNCLTEILFDDALKRAQELDDYKKENHRLVGPLHGVPMTLKDQFDVAGYDSTIGYVGRAFKPAKEDAVLVDMLKHMGAVIIAKTNLPQSIMWCETENPLWGLTTHPKDLEFTPGGSSGGEGALLALHGSVVGWGTDIGGSIRIPSHICGLYGFKPSSTRLPYHGVTVSTEGQEHIPSVIGPMARNMESLISASKAVMSASPWLLDPKCTPIPWRSGPYIEVQTRPLVIGVMYDDGMVKPHPPITRVLNEVVTGLKNAGHEILEWDPSMHAECIKIMDQYFTADGGEDIRRDVEAGGEPYVPHVEALVNRGEAISVYDYWQLNRRKHVLQKQFLDLWNKTRGQNGTAIDMLITPVMPHAAVKHRSCRWVGYTKVFNFVDYPAAVVPAGVVDKEKDAEEVQKMGEHEPRNELDKANWELFDMESMDGMNVGLQIVTKRLEEEKCLGGAKVVDEMVKMLKEGKTGTPEEGGVDVQV